MDKKLFETLKNLDPLIQEMGKVRLEQYIQRYCELDISENNFYFEFEEYIEKNKEISIDSFTTFLFQKHTPELLEVIMKALEAKQQKDIIKE